ANLGCTSTQTTQVTVAANPTISITPSSTLICVTTSATLTAAGADTYTWSPIASLNTDTGSIVTATPTTSTTYSVTGTLGICPSTQTVLITVIIPPTPTITAGGPTTFCQGGSVTLTSSTGTTYLWSTGAITQTISVNTSGNYSVTTTNVNGCFATSTTTSVTVNPLPTASITPSGSTTFCQGDSVTLNANNGLSWLWSTGETTQSIKVITSGTYTVSVTNICGSIASSPVTVTVNSLPATTVTQSGSTTFCQGNSVKLTASVGSSYLWSNGDTTQTIKVDSAGNYSVIVINSFGCHATSSSTSVTVNPLAVAAFTPGEVKASMTYSFTNTSTNAVSYAWIFGDGQTSTAVNPTNVYAVGGIYNVTLIATNGCGSDTVKEILAVVSNSEFYNGFSPNGDGHNDFWNIPTLNDNTTNTVKVLNRWGSEVWQGVNYDNVSVVWKGQNMSGEDLPDGTYYFIITYGNVDKRGWVIIKR
ncbi:MAG: gliding motility-associated C-terminal domain-containing protein, partial [Bacteroidia bacterium]